MAQSKPRPPRAPTRSRRGKLDSIGGLAYLTKLQNTVPSPENLDYCIPELRESQNY